MLAATLLLLAIAAVLVYALGAYEDAHLEDSFDADHSHRERL